METSDPAALASPMGKSVWGKKWDARYAPGTRASRMDRKLCRNESSDRPMAQK